MENQNNVEQVDGGVSTDGYYITKGRKVGDFFTGFLGILIGWFIGSILNLLFRNIPFLYYIFNPHIFPFLVIVLGTVLAWLFFKYKRKFISIGIILALIFFLPQIIFVLLVLKFGLPI